MIPIIDLTLPKSLNTQIKKEVEKVIDSKNYVLGPQVESFEKNFAEYIGVKFAIGVGSGTDALRLSLRALGVGRGDKVLTVALTSPFTALAIAEEGAIPVFCDVDEATWTIDLADAQKKVDKKTRAIIPVHLFGNPADMPSILKFAKRHKLLVIEDACQAHGATIDDKKVGSFADAAAFSFYPTKNLGAMGDSGAVVTSNEKVANMVKILRHGGQTKRFWHKYQGINSRLDEIQAAILTVKLKYIDIENKEREKIARKYQRELSDLPLIFQRTINGAKSAYHLFVTRTNKRDQLMTYLTIYKIASDIYYPYPIHLNPAFKQYNNNKLPITENLTKELLALPLYPALPNHDQDKIVNLIKKYFQVI